MKLEGRHANLPCGWRFPGLFPGEQVFQDDRELVIFAPLLAPFWTGFSYLPCYHRNYHGVHYSWSNSWQWSCYLVFYQVRSGFFRWRLLLFKCGTLYSFTALIINKKSFFYLNAWSLLNFFLLIILVFLFMFLKTYIYFFENDKTKARVQHNVTPPFFLPGPFIRYMYSQRPLDWLGGGGVLGFLYSLYHA